jgi:hypothetical protein
MSQRCPSSSKRYVETVIKAVPGHVGSNILLRHGRVWPCDPALVITRPRRYLPRHCYYNAWQLALHEPRKYTYVEGYAHMGVMPVSHAWVVDSEGNVLDPTWQDLAERSDYFGVPFKIQFLNRMALKTEYAGIFENIECMRYMRDLIDRPDRWLAPHPFTNPGKPQRKTKHSNETKQTNTKRHR